MLHIKDLFYPFRYQNEIDFRQLFLNDEKINEVKVKRQSIRHFPV